MSGCEAATKDQAPTPRTKEAFAIGAVLLLGVTSIVGRAQLAPQNPSQMVDTTRPHPRVAEYAVDGRRLPLSRGTVYLAPGFDPRAPATLLVHFHGAPWLIEHHVASAALGVVLVTVQLGSGSRVYADSFSDERDFDRLIAEARQVVERASPVTIDWTRVVLSSFSAGYGAIRAILRHSMHYRSVDGIILADSMHAAYVDSSAPAALGIARAVVLEDVDVFVRFARDALTGNKQMLVIHSEVYPGTYASTTETADHLLDQLTLVRTPVLESGPVGMQQLSRVRDGEFELFWGSQEIQLPTTSIICTDSVAGFACC